MPVVAVIGAVIVDALAASSFAAVVAGAATIGQVLTVVGAVGATIGAVGVVTRDKGLQTAGLVMGGISAVGGLASAAGLIDSSASLFGQSATAGSEAGSIGAASAEQISSEIPGGSPALMGGAGHDIISSLSPTTIPETMSDTGVSVSAAGNINVPSPVDSLNKTVASATGNASAMVSNPADVIEQGGAVIPKSIDITSSPAGFSADGTSAGGLGGVMNFAKNNPMVTYGLLQTAGSMVSGMFNPLTPAQINAANAQAENNRAQATLTSQQAANIRSGIPVASLSPVKSAPVTGSPAGLINRPIGAAA